MIAVKKLALYIDRSHSQWIVRDNEGNFWSLPTDDNAWEQRKPYYLTEDAALESVPAHYKYALGVPE